MGHTLILPIEIGAAWSPLIGAIQAGSESLNEIRRRVAEAETNSLSEQKQHLEMAIKRAEDRVEVLQRQRESEAEGLRLDEQTVANIRNLFDRGLVPATRLEEVKRAALVTASRALQLEAAIASARRDAVELEAELLALDSKAQRGCLEDLSQAVSSAQSIASLLAAGSLGADRAARCGVDCGDYARGGDPRRRSRRWPLAELLADIVKVRLIPRTRSDS